MKDMKMKINKINITRVLQVEKHIQEEMKELLKR